jgi:ribosomal-protein-alanine N-acetyltransferase
MKPEVFPYVRLATPRLLLRPLVPEDAPQLFAIFSDAQVMRYWSSVPWPSMEFAHAFIERDRQAMAAGDYLRLGVVRIEGGVLMGMCTLFSFMEQCRRAEVGYGFAKHAWGLGYMQESVGRMLQYGFEELGLNRVEADTDPRNAASGRSLERLGFQREGLLRERWIVGDEVSDTALYGLLRSDWEAHRATIRR